MADEDIDSEYHEITKPAYRKTDWHHDYYDFVDTVDSNLKLSGPIGERPASGDVPEGVWYFDDGNNIIYENTDSGWVAIGGLGSENEKLPEFFTESLTTEALNNVALVNAADGAGEVQNAVDNYDTVYVYADSESVTWSDNVEVPSDTTLKAWNLFTINLASGHNITPKEFETSTDDVRGVIVNQDFENGDENVRIEGFHVDCQQNFDGSADHRIAVLLYHSDNSKIVDCVGENVNGNFQSEGVGLVRCTDSELVDSEGHNCDYQGFGIQGGENCTAIRCDGTDNGVHQGQIHADNEDPRQDATNATFRECGTMDGGKILVHGNEAAQECETIRFEDCTAPYFQAIGTVSDVDFENCTANGAQVGVDIRTTSSPSAQTLEGITIDGLSYEMGESEPARGVDIRILTEADGSTIRDVKIINADKIEAGQIVRLTDNSGTDTTIHNIRIRESQLSVPSSYTVDTAFVWLSDSEVGDLWASDLSGNPGGDLDGSGTRNADFWSIINSDLTDVDNETAGDGNATTTNRSNNRT